MTEPPPWAVKYHGPACAYCGKQGRVPGTWTCSARCASFFEKARAVGILACVECGRRQAVATDEWGFPPLPFGGYAHFNYLSHCPECMARETDDGQSAAETPGEAPQPEGAAPERTAHEPPGASGRGIPAKA